MRYPVTFLIAIIAVLCDVLPAISAPCEKQILGGPQNWITPLASKARLSRNEAGRNWSRERSVNLGGGKKTVAVYSATHAGNGTIRIKNLELRVWRAHEGEGFTYRPQSLNVELSAKPSSHVCRLTVSGGIEMLDSDNKPIARRAVQLIYEYNPQRDAFTRIEARTPIAINEIELSEPK
jgi:hypothetical protein